MSVENRMQRGGVLASVLDEEELVELIEQLDEQLAQLQKRFTRQRQAGVNALYSRLGVELDDRNPLEDFAFTLQELEEAYAILSQALCDEQHYNIFPGRNDGQ